MKIIGRRVVFAALIAAMMILGLSIGAEAYGAESAPGGTVTVDTTDAAVAEAESALGASNVVIPPANPDSNTLTITLQEDVTLSSPVRFVKGTVGKKVVLNLNGHELRGKAGEMSEDYSESTGGNAVEIAADEFNVEITGSGSVIGGKGAQHIGEDHIFGDSGGSAVFFCERVDNLHGPVTQSGDFDDEGYIPDELNYGLSVTGGAELIGGAGADVTYEDWHSNVCGEYGRVVFFASAGQGGPGIGQIITGIGVEKSLEELSYAKITIEKGVVRGGAGGNADTGDHLFTTTDIQKIDAIQQFMNDKGSGYQFDSQVKDSISINPADGGNGIEFYAGRKYIDVEKDGEVYGGCGGSTICSERASMVKTISSQCGDGGSGIYVCGDTGLTNEEASLSVESADDAYWENKSKDSDDVGIYIAGLVKGGASPDTTLLNDKSGNGGTGIECDLDGSRHLCARTPRATFDANRGIVLVDTGGSVFGGDSGTPDGRTISGGNGADAITGGATGSPANSSPPMKAAHFIVRGNVTGGYGSSVGGPGIGVEHEQEYLDDTLSSAYFAGVICGDGTVRGGDCGEWPDLGNNTRYTVNDDGMICKDGQLVRAEGIFTGVLDPESLTISPSIQEEQGEPPHLMEQDDSFTVSAEMTPFEEKPTAATRLRCTVNKPSGYEGKAYVIWQSEIDVTTPIRILRVEGANGAYNNFNLLGDSDYPYGIKEVSYGREYTIDVATHDRMAEKIKYNDSGVVEIYCYAILEDGREVKSNTIWFSKFRRSPDGWSGSGGGPTQEEIDQQAADAVEAMIDALPLLAHITLADADAVAAARAAYEALTDEQKALLAPYTYLLDDLGRAEAKIEELKQEAQGKADAVEALINALEGKVEAIDPEADDAEGAIEGLKAQIEEAIAAYNELTNDEKAFVNEDILNNLNEVKDQFNETFPDSSITEEIEPYQPKPAGPIELTAGMVTLSKTKYTYNGKAQTPAVTVKCEGKTLVKGTDYKVSYAANKYAGKTGAAKAIVEGLGGYTGKVTKSFTIVKAANTLKVSAKTATVKYKKVKKKNQVLGVTKVIKFSSKGQGTKTYTKASGNKKIVINKKTGKVTVKKKLKKGTYKVKVKVRAGGTTNYNAVTRTVTFKIKIK